MYGRRRRDGGSLLDGTAAAEYSDQRMCLSCFRVCNLFLYDVVQCFKFKFKFEIIIIIIFKNKLIIIISFAINASFFVNICCQFANYCIMIDLAFVIHLRAHFSDWSVVHSLGRLDFRIWRLVVRGQKSVDCLWPLQLVQEIWYTFFVAKNFCLDLFLVARRYSKFRSNDVWSFSSIASSKAIKTEKER